MGGKVTGGSSFQESYKHSSECESTNRPSIQRDPSWAVRCKSLVEAGQDAVVGEHTCSVALDISGEDGRGIAGAIRS